MGSVVGFTICRALSPEETTRAFATEERALSHFTHLEKKNVNLGSSTLHLWGHSKLSDCIHTLPDESTLLLVGTPHNEVPWQTVEEHLLKSDRPEDFTIPWEGRIILLRISVDGNRWTMWNDWLGSIPTYRSEMRNGRIASTLEPVTVTAAGCSTDDFFLPGLVALLINGYPLADWTLYKNVNTIPPDSAITWDEKGFHAKRLWTVQPSQDRWEAGWDNLVDEMHALSYKAISDILKTRPAWTVPLSSGLDSRLIAGVAAEVGANLRTYAWGPAENTDVIYSRDIARTLGFPWKHVALPSDYLVKYTHPWFDMFGSAMHFQGMYLMSFLDEIKAEPAAPILTGFIGDVLAGDELANIVTLHSSKSYQVDHEWYSNWGPEQLRALVKFPIDEALEANAANLTEQIESFPGARYQQLTCLELWNRQRSFISFLSTLKDYWRGVATPFMDRSYARFCLSLPRAVLDERRLLGDVFRRYYGRLAVIPGSYANDPYIPTGGFLIRRRIAHLLPVSFRNRLFKKTEKLNICVDFEPMQAYKKESLWPLFDAWKQLSKWLDMEQVERDFNTVMRSRGDVRPLRRLQAVQTFASRLLP